VILMRPGLIASFLGIPFEQRYYVYLMGIALWGLVYLMQRPRTPKAVPSPAVA
jgi:hypothetical protein